MRRPVNEARKVMVWKWRRKLGDCDPEGTLAGWKGGSRGRTSLLRAEAAGRPRPWAGPGFSFSEEEAVVKVPRGYCWCRICF